ncbi:MAG TPA: TSUP family transporter, partial [Elusimicrobiales bacterium]|nr:TSUP family transporter [Elusimicrobiales bacterium]
MTILAFLGLTIMGSAIVIVGAMLGIGAGFIVVPVLVLIFGLPMHNAITISLVVIVAMSVSVSRLNVRRGFVNV